MAPPDQFSRSRGIALIEVDPALVLNVNIVGGGTGGGNVDLTQVGGAAYALGAALTVASMPVNVASDQVLNVNVVGGGGGGGNVNLNQVGGAAFAQGARTKAQSLSMTVATDQGAIPVSATQLPSALGSGVKAGALLTTIATDQGAIPITSSAQLPAALGPGVKAGAFLVTMATDQPAQSQNLSQVGGSAFALGQGTKAQSLSVSLASDQGALSFTSTQLPLALGSGVKAGALLTTIATDQGSFPNYITDSTGANAAAVKAANTSPVATDPALVVTLSPNTPASVIPKDSTGTYTLTTNGQTTAPLLVNSAGSGILSLTGTWTGNLQIEASAGDGVWDSIIPMNATANFFVSGGLTANGQYNFLISGWAQVRVRATATMTGSATLTLNLGLGPGIFINQGNGIGSNSSAWIVGIVDPNSGNGPVTVKAASTASVAADLAVVTAISANTLNQDTKAMAFGSKFGLPIVAQSAGVGRMTRVDKRGRERPGYDSLLFKDFLEGTTINPQWTQSTGTMTLAQTGGILTVNSASTLTTTTFALLTSATQYPFFVRGATEMRVRGALTIGATNSFFELGFGAPVGTTAVVSNGAFFRVNGTTVQGVVSYNGTEVTTAASALTSLRDYNWIIQVDEDFASFIVEDSSGTPIIDLQVSMGLLIPFWSNTSHLPNFVRIRNSAAVATTMKFAMSACEVFGLDVDRNKPWAHQQAGIGLSSIKDPTTYAQTAQLAVAADPATATLSNTACAYATLGGEYVFNAAAQGVNVLGVFGWTNPAPYKYLLTDIVIPLPFVLTALGAAAYAHEWVVMVGSTSNPSTSVAVGVALAPQGAAASALPGTFLSGTPVALRLDTPIVVLPGQVLIVGLKVALGLATGSLRGSIFLNGYFE